MYKVCGQDTFIQTTISVSPLYLHTSMYFKGDFLLSLWQKGKTAFYEILRFWTYYKDETSQGRQFWPAMIPCSIPRILDGYCLFLSLKPQVFYYSHFLSHLRALKLKLGKEWTSKKKKKSFILKNWPARGKEESKLLSQKTILTCKLPFLSAKIPAIFLDYVYILNSVSCWGLLRRVCLFLYPFCQVS